VLTKKDLQAIREIVDTRLDTKLDEKLNPVTARFDSVEKRLESIEEKIKPIKRMATNIRQMRKDLDGLIKRDYENDVFLQRRVTIIERHLKLPSLEKPSPQN